MRREILGLSALLALLGAGWGLTLPLVKIAVSTGYQPFGLIFWQLVIGVVVLGCITRVGGKPLPLQRRHILLYLTIALLGTVLPNAASFAAAAHLPAGLLSILISTVPMFAFPIAIAFGVDHFSALRFAGLLCGLVAVFLIIGPEASLPSRAMLAFIPLALLAPLLYAIEGNVVAKWGTFGVGPIQVLLGASLVGAIIALPLAVASGQFIDPRPPWSKADAAMVGSSMIHAIVYSTYVWLVVRAGSTFAAQVAYFVTGFGVVWSMLLLGERYSGWIWGALLLMMAGLFLVQPRPRREPAVEA